MDFEQIEDAIINEVRTRVPYLRTVETYAGQLEDDISKLPVRFPAVFIAYGGSDFSWLDGPSYQEKATFSALLCAKSLRGQEAARKEPQGAYSLIRDVLAALTNRDFGLGIERLSPTRASLVFVSGTLAVYGIDFQTSFDSTYEW